MWHMSFDMMNMCLSVVDFRGSHVPEFHEEFRESLGGDLHRLRKRGLKLRCWEYKYSICGGGRAAKDYAISKHAYHFNLLSVNNASYYNLPRYTFTLSNAVFFVWQQHTLLTMSNLTMMLWHVRYYMRVAINGLGRTCTALRLYRLAHFLCRV